MADADRLRAGTSQQFESAIATPHVNPQEVGKVIDHHFSRSSPSYSFGDC